MRSSYQIGTAYHCLPNSLSPPTPTGVFPLLSQEEAVCTLKAPSRAALPSWGICEVGHFCVTWQI